MTSPPVIRCLGSLAVALILLAPAVAAAQDDSRPGEMAAMVRVDGGGNPVRAYATSIDIRGDVRSVRAAGALIDIEANVSGGVQAAGARVIVDGQVENRIRAAGASVDVRGRIGGRVQAAGAVVSIGATTEGDVSLAGATVDVTSGASIGGLLSAAGATVTVDGALARGADLAGAIVVFNGSAEGTVEADGQRIVIGPGARIGGDLVVRSHNDPTIAEGATISGQIVREDPRRWWQWPSWLWYGAGAFIVALGAIVAAIILLLVARGAFEDGLEHAAFRPLSSGLIGVITLVLLPIIAVILMTTVFGISIGLALVFLLPIILVAGHALAAAGIGLWVIDRTGPPRSFGRILLFAVVGAVIVAVVGLIPWIGPILVFLAILVGSGAYLRAVGARLYRAEGHVLK